MVNFSENKFLYTVRPFKWLSVFASEKGVILITPQTTVDQLFKMKPNSEFYESFINVGDGATRLLNVAEIERTITLVNERFCLPVFSFDRSGEKIAKAVFEIEDNLFVSNDFLNAYFTFLDAATSKKQTIVLAGFEDLVFGDFKMLTIHLLITATSSRINWGNLQQLVMLDFQDLEEIIDRDKFKSWLELKTRTVLSIEDINSYFRGDATMNAFLIEKALSQLK